MRIVAGALRSRAIRAPKGDATRPTTDRVRESLFSVLGDVGGTNVLDLYAGSGALALEAISRGATRATCVESARAAIVAIEDNARTLDVRDRLRVVGKRVSECVAAIAKDAPFDLVFADPPWSRVNEGSVAKEISAIVKTPEILAQNALIVLEHAARDAAPELDGAQLEETRRWGDTAVAFYRVVAPSVAPHRETC